jgi:hypothetical protein
MMRPLTITGEVARKAICRHVLAAPDGHVVTISEPKKRRIQEEKYHAMICDIAKCCTFMGKRWHEEDWKRLLVDAFAKAMRDAGTPIHHDGRVVPSLDMKRVVQLGIQTREFWVREAADFIEYLFAFGEENGVEWSDPFTKPEE